MATPPSSSNRARQRRRPTGAAGPRPPATNGGRNAPRGQPRPDNRAPAAPPVRLEPVEVPTGPGSFAELGVPHVLCEVLARQGLLSAFPIQTATLPDALNGRDVLGQGRTGSGKTLAFALPIVARLAATARRSGDKRPRALVLVPTRELASQVEAVIKPLAAAVGLRSATIFGGVGAAPQIAALRAGTEIIIGCPGRLADHLGTGALDLGAVEITVLDEADHMADVGFLPTVRRLMDRTPEGGQRLLFSATLAGGVDQVVRQYMDAPISHAVATEAPVEMTHHVIVVHDDDRVALVAGLARTHRLVVFTRTKHRAKQLTKKLSFDGLAAVELHGNLSQNARTKNLDAFADGSATALIATDIAARGIHVDEVPLVVHADPPTEHKAYVHRSGRTARAGAAGTVITIATGDQVSEVKDLLRRAEITATWSQLPVGSSDAAEVLSGGGTRFDVAGAGRSPSTGGRPAGRGGGARSGAGRPTGGGGGGGGRGTGGGARNPAAAGRPAGNGAARPAAAVRAPGAGSGRAAGSGRSAGTPAGGRGGPGSHGSAGRSGGAASGTPTSGRPARRRPAR